MSTDDQRAANNLPRKRKYVVPKPPNAANAMAVRKRVRREEMQNAMRLGESN